MIKEEHWREVLGNMPMPPDATVEMMWAAYDALHQMDEVEEALKELPYHEGMREHYQTRLNTETDPQKRATLISILKSCDEIIDFYREKLHG